MTKLTEGQKLSMCHGCRDNFYNTRGMTGVTRCWNLKDAKPVERVAVGTWDAPPYLWRPETTLSCHRPEGVHWLKREDVRVMDEKRYNEVTVTKESREAWLRS